MTAATPPDADYAAQRGKAVCAVVSLVSAALMPDHTGRDVSAEYDEGDAQGANQVS